MSIHRAKTHWRRTTADFEPESYGRDHMLVFSGGARLEASSAPEYKGNPALPNPEELLVGALASCHMLTFLAVCAKRGLVVESYEDEAAGELEKNAEGRLAVTRITLRPLVRFGQDASVDAAQLEKLHVSAHRGCFIGASIKAEVRVEPRG